VVSCSIREANSDRPISPTSPSACERTATPPVLLLAVADHQHVRVAAERGVADLPPDRLRTIVDRDPDAELAELVVGAPDVLVVAVGDRQDDRLNGASQVGKRPA